MGRNNVIAFVSHVVIHLFTFSLFLITGEDIGLVILLFLLPAYLFAYYKVGNYLEKQENLLKKFISVSSVPIVGLIVWLYCVLYVASYKGGSLFIGPEIVWLFYFIYNNFSIIAGYIFSELIDSYLMMVISLLIINLIPSAIMIAGMKNSKSNRKNNKYPE